MADLPLRDPLDRKIARNIARKVLTDTDPADPKAAFNVEFADALLQRVTDSEQDQT